MEHLIVNFTPKEYKRIYKRIFKNPTSGCWDWMGSRDDLGYGLVWYNNRTERIHRVMYSLLIAPVPRGVIARRIYSLDHLCRNTSCCNPEHLELVTQKENILRGISKVAIQARQTHCKYGHGFKPLKRGGRYCPTCDNLRHKKRMQGPKREYWLEKQRQAAARYYAKQK